MKSTSSGLYVTDISSCIFHAACAIMLVFLVYDLQELYSSRRHFLVFDVYWTVHHLDK